MTYIIFLQKEKVLFSSSEMAEFFASSGADLSSDPHPWARVFQKLREFMKNPNGETAFELRKCHDELDVALKKIGEGYYTKHIFYRDQLSPEEISVYKKYSEWWNQNPTPQKEIPEAIWKEWLGNYVQISKNSKESLDAMEDLPPVDKFFKDCM